MWIKGCKITSYVVLLTAGDPPFLCSRCCTSHKISQTKLCQIYFFQTLKLVYCCTWVAIIVTTATITGGCCALLWIEFMTIQKTSKKLSGERLKYKSSLQHKLFYFKVKFLSTLCVLHLLHLFFIEKYVFLMR